MFPSISAWQGGLASAATARHIGFRPDRAASDFGARRYVSQWRVLYFGGGNNRPFRRRLHAEVKPVPKQVGRWMVEYYVERQTVEEMTRNMQPREEDWVPAGQDAESERRFVAHLRGALGMYAVPMETKARQDR